MKCPYCGSERIESRILWSKTAETGAIGLAYKSAIFVGTAQVYSDLCLDCGSIIKTYIEGDTNKKWIKK